MSPDHAHGEPTPLEPDQLDELLSAALDGEFDGAARDLGLSVDEAEARFAQPRAPIIDASSSPRHATCSRKRRPSTSCSRRASAPRPCARPRPNTPRTTLDRKRRRNRILLSTAGIAAAVAAVVAVATGVNGFHPDSYSSSASSKASSSPTSAARRELGPAPATGTTTVDALGSFADARALGVAAVQRDATNRALFGADRLGAEVQPTFGANDGQAVSTGKAPAPSDQAKSSTKTSIESRSGADAPTQYDGAAHPAASCNAPPQVPTGATPALRASATLAGKPVVVLVFTTATEHVVVIEDLACKLVNLQMLH